VDESVSFGWSPSGFDGGVKIALVDAWTCVGAATPSTFSSAVVNGIRMASS